jgi:hypothetical protein
VAIWRALRYDAGMTLFISIKQAAALAGVHPNTVKRWCRASQVREAAGAEPDFIFSKPGGTRNARVRIERASFIAFVASSDQRRRLLFSAKMPNGPFRTCPVTTEAVAAPLHPVHVAPAKPTVVAPNARAPRGTAPHFRYSLVAGTPSTVSRAIIASFLSVISANSRGEACHS